MVHECPSLLSITVMNTMTEGNLGRKQFVSSTILQSYSHPSGKEVRARPQDRTLDAETEKNLKRNVTSCLSLDGLHSLISDTTQHNLATCSHSFSDLGLSISLVN